MYGHLEDECRKKRKVLKVWKPIQQKTVPVEPASSQPRDKEGFSPITKSHKTSPRRGKLDSDE